MFKTFVKNFSFTILCPEKNISGLRTTATYCRDKYKTDCQCIVGDNTNLSQISEMSRYCPVVKAGKTITSLIDTGIKTSKLPWTMVIMAGSYVYPGMINKYLYFCRSEKDILFPAIDRKMYFDEASINGIMINKKAMEEVRELGNEYNDIKLAKLVWADKAIEKGYKFKALVGVRFF